MNKDLYHRKAKLPESLKTHLQKSLKWWRGTVTLRVTTEIKI